MTRKLREKTRRLDWDEFFMLKAALYSSRGSCDRLQNGCIFVKDKRIVGAGYNGSVAGQATCDEIGHLMIDGHCERTIHGEENAILNSVDMRRLEGATSYSTGTPCLACIKKMVQVGIKRIVYVGEYNNQDGNHIWDLCKERDVALERFTEDPHQIVELLNVAVGRMQGPGGLLRDLPDIKLVVDDAPQEL